MSRLSILKSLIPTLPLLTVSYHMSKLMAVITNNSSGDVPLELPPALVAFLTRALLIWVEGGVHEEVSV